MKYNKQNVIRRDGHKCQYCCNIFSASELTLDHVVPKSRGGTTCYENVVACCRDCNTKKGDKTLLEVNMRLKQIPIHPDWLPINIFNRQDVPEQWKAFCYHL